MDKEIAQEYQRLLQTETKKLFWEHFEGRKKFTEPILLAILSVTLTAAGLFVVNGAITVSEIWIAVIPTIGVPLLWACIVWYTSLKTAHINIYKEQSNETDKYNWNRVYIEPKSFDILGLDGWGLTITNKKGVLLDNVSIWLHGIRVGQDWKILDKQEMFGYLNERAELLSFDSEKILPTKSVTFVITARDDGMPGIWLRTEKRRENILHAESVAVDITVKAKIESYELPLKLMRLNVYRNGKISIRRDYT